MRRICSKKSDLIANVGKLKGWFKEMVNKETKRALESSSLGCSNTSERSVSGNCGTGVPLVVNCNPILCCLGQVIRKNLCFLDQDEEVKQVFNSPFVSFRTVRTLRSHLVSVKVYPVGEKLVGSRKCNKNRCQVCKNVIETETFQYFVDKKVYKINDRFTCSDKYLVYPLSCKVCGMQYNGQTNDKFRYRWKGNNWKSLRGEDHKQAGFFAHFQTAGHSGFINDTEIRFIDKTDPCDRYRREDFWIDTLKTRYSQGYNNIDPYH